MNEFAGEVRVKNNKKNFHPIKSPSGHEELEAKERVIDEAVASGEWKGIRASPIASESRK